MFLERTSSIFRGGQSRTRILYAIISRRCFQVNANLQVTLPLHGGGSIHSSWNWKTRNASSSLFKADEEAWGQRPPHASNWIASFIRRDNASGSGATRLALVPHFREKSLPSRSIDRSTGETLPRNLSRSLLITRCR